MKTEMSVFFKMMQKDDKKEVLKFEIPGNDDGEAEGELFLLAGSIIIFNIEGCGAGDVTAEFVSMQRDSKKTVMKFAIKGDSEDKAQQLYKFAGRNVDLSIAPSQMTIEEFNHNEHEGIEYKVNGDGTIEVDHDQVTIEDVEASNNAEASADNVADLATARNRRGGGRKKEDVQNAEDNAADAFDDTDAELLKTVE